jgi:ribosomal protein L29
MRKSKEIQTMSKEDRKKNLQELKLELVKSRASASKTGSSKIKEIKKRIARIMTINNLEKSGELNKK